MRARPALVPVLLSVALVGAGAATSATAVASPVVLDDVVVAGGSLGTVLTGLEVDRTTITWGSEPDSEAPFITSVEYMPTVGDYPLEILGAVEPEIEQALYAATSDRWAVGFDPYADTASDGYGLWVKNLTDGLGVTVLMHLEPTFGPWDGSVSLWGDTAVVGHQVVNLRTGDVWVLAGPEGATEEELAAEPWRCLDGSGAALDHGDLVLFDVCRHAVVVADVPFAGATAAGLTSARVLAESPTAWLFTLSGDGLLAYVDGFEGPTTLVWMDLDGSTAPQSVELAGEPLAVRAEGRRIVVVTAGTEEATAWLVEAEAGLVGPIAAVAPEGLGLDEAAALRSWDESSSMSLDYLPLDLHGRTLAWSADGQVRAGTLPALTSEATPVLHLPEAVAAGATLTIGATGFLPGEPVLVSVGAWFEEIALADDDGAFSLDVQVPAEATGEQAVVLSGVDSGWEVAGAVTVTPGATPEPTTPTTPPATPGQNPGLEVRTGR